MNTNKSKKKSALSSVGKPIILKTFINIIGSVEKSSIPKNTNLGLNSRLSIF